MAACTAAAQATGRVYRATCPLEGWEAAAEALGPLYPPQLHLHHFVVLESLPPTHSSGSGGSGDGGSSSDSSSSGRSASGGGSSSAGSSGRSASGDGAVAVVAYDFLPADPTHPLTAATLLSGGSTPGLARSRPLRGVPRRRCQLAGVTTLADPHAAAAEFQRRYGGRRLQLLRHDCTHHTQRLIDYLLAGGKADLTGGEVLAAV